MHNKFIFKLNGKKVAYAENIVLNQMWAALEQTGYNISLGSSNTEPDVSDTELGSLLWTLDAVSVSHEVTSETSLTITTAFSVPASSSYVGNIKEVGLRRDGVLFTHALLKDAEGNPITLSKTADDLLEIEAVIYFNTTSMPSTSKCRVFPMNVSDWRNIMKATKDVLEVRARISPSILLSPSGAGNGLWARGNFMFALSNMSFDSANHMLYLSNYELGEGYGNYNYLNFFEADLLFFARFKDIMSPYTIPNIPVGIGDGETTVFNKPLPYFIEDSDIVKINDVVLTRDVDYTIDHRSMRLAQCCNSAMSVLIGSDDVSAVITSGTLHPIAVPATFDDSVGTPGNGCGCSEEYPYIFDTELCDLGNEVNTLTVNFAHVRVYGSELSTPNTGKIFAMNTVHGKYAVYGSNNLSNWTKLAEKDYSTTYPTNTLQTFSWNATTYRYYKFTVDFTSDTGHGNYPTLNRKIFIPYWPTYQGDYPSNITPIMFGYPGQEIVFTDPPVSGAVISMDCQVDRPYKNSNYKMTFNVSMQM